MNQLMSQLARGEQDIAVGRSGQRYDDPQLQMETFYTEPISFVSGTQHPLAGNETLTWENVLARHTCANCTRGSDRGGGTRATGPPDAAEQH
jgi:DNA-binding transcriptional LysR family regulator